MKQKSSIVASCDYETPRVEFIDLSVEQGFKISGYPNYNDEEEEPLF